MGNRLRILIAIILLAVVAGLVIKLALPTPESITIDKTLPPFGYDHSQTAVVLQTLFPNGTSTPTPPTLSTSQYTASAVIRIATETQAAMETRHAQYPNGTPTRSQQELSNEQVTATSARQTADALHTLQPLPTSIEDPGIIVVTPTPAMTETP